ncbi:hypothetical protein [Pseudomonas glycinae]|uniref:hypothetical protein n=1 Tax=Pseudomonas glycinae TaxID=1785145 RepID=UPI001F1DED86|nr:hypothetical protein [Pseudomonas glycinae]
MDLRVEEEMSSPYGPADETWQYGYSKDQLNELKEYYRDGMLRYVVRATWSVESNGWIVKHVSMEAYNNYKSKGRVG